MAVEMDAAELQLGNPPKKQKLSWGKKDPPHKKGFLSPKENSIFSSTFTFLHF